MSGIYIHIPFCKSRCIYCSFFSSVNQSLYDEYTRAICKEIDLRKNFLKNDMDISTIYIGGGTPSQLPVSRINDILLHIYKVYKQNIKQNEIEITIECNPDDVSLEYAIALQQIGINRVSIGVQTFNDQRLHFINRRHNVEKAKQAILNLKQAGISNISIDLMFGFPCETIDDLNFDIQQAIALDVQHISVYCLSFEENTPLYSKLQNKEVEELDDNILEQMYFNVRSKLTKAGFIHYEISNFAKPNFESKHNTSYWQDKFYLGLGASACSYNGEKRTENIANLQQYIDGIKENNPKIDSENIDKTTYYNDIITTQFRLCNGISIDDIHKKFGKYFADYFLFNAKQGLEKGLFVLENNRIKLAEKALFISNSVISNLIYIDD